MKKSCLRFICIIAVLLAMVGCDTPKEQPPLVAEESYVTAFQTTHSETAICYELSGTTLKIWGTVKDESKGFVLVPLNGDTENGKFAQLQGGAFRVETELPESAEITVDIYVGAERYGQYDSLIANFVTVKKGDGFTMAPVYKQNQELFSRDKNPSEHLDSTKYIQSADEEIVALGREITQGLSKDYQKLQAIHDWVAANVYYDFDAFYSGDLGAVDAKAVLSTKKSVCAGYANLTAALARSVGIPCRVQSGFALGIGEEQAWTKDNLNETETNHAWNEAYVDGRWIILDTTWDSGNEYRNGEYLQAEAVTQLYFDSTMEFFSFSHKLMESTE